MKSLVNGCAAAALLAGLAGPAYAQIAVRPAPVHSVPADPRPDAATTMTMAPPADAPTGADQDDDGILPAKPAPPQPQPVQPPPEPLPVAAAEPRPDPVRPARTEPASVAALVRARAPVPPPSLTPDETAFFAVLGQRVTDAASVYESYVRGVDGLDPAFADAGAVRKAVRVGAAYQPDQLQEGIVAYAALIALRDPAFVDGVRQAPPGFTDGLALHPGRVLQVPGAQEAAADAAGVLRAQGETLIAAGKAITKAAYDVQTQAWSRTPVGDPQTVLEGAKTSGAQLRAATVPFKARLLASLVAAPQAPSSDGASAPDVVRGLALAALAINGATGDDKEARYEMLLHDTSAVNCLRMAKLNLNQCLAVAGPHYEDVYCTGRHAVADTGRCVSAAATGEDVLPAPDAAPARLQATEAYGPEQAEAYGRPPAPAEDVDDAPVPAGPQRYAPPPAYPPAPPQAEAYAQNDYRAPAPPVYPAQAPPRYAPSPYAQTPYAAQGYPQPANPAPQYPPPQAYPPQQPYPYASAPAYQPYGAYAPYYGR